MSGGRKMLLYALVPLVALLIALGLLGGLGSVELVLWLLLLAAWIVAFVVSARRRSTDRT